MLRIYKLQIAFDGYLLGKKIVNQYTRDHVTNQLDMQQNRTMQS